MKALKILATGLLLLMILLIPVLAMAQDPVFPTPEALAQNPFVTEPLDLAQSWSSLLAAFHAGWYILISFGIYLLMNFFRGKLKIGSWEVKIPALSAWMDGAGAKWKMVFIIGLTGIGSAFGALALVKDWTAWPIIKGMLSGLVAGIYTALGAMGFNNAISLWFPKKDAPVPAPNG